MAWKKEAFGAAANGREVCRYTLTNANGVSASFTDLGGIWLTMVVPDRDGNMADVVLGRKDPQGIQSNGGHLGEPVGRNANRIGGAAFTLNGVTYALAVNSGTCNNLHSGPDWYRDRIWDAAVFETGEGTRIDFSLFSPDGDQNYPGNANITVSYTLTPDNALRLDYRLVSDADTIANFTNHAYFNLAGHASGTILDQIAWLDADTYTEADEQSIPTGNLIPVAGTPMDFTVPKAIGRDIRADYPTMVAARGYDHNWAFNHKKGEMALSASLYDPKSGRFMEVFTDLPGIQFYTGNSLKGEGKEGAVYGPNSGCCFETQFFPDAINKPQFDSPVVRANETCHTTTIYRFSVKA